MKYKYPWFKPSVLNSSQNKNRIPEFKTMGKLSLRLEKKISKILKVKNVILTTSGTSALMMAYLALGASNKKKIICTNLSWIATINPALILGCKIYLVDTIKMSQTVNFKILNNLIKKIRPDIVVLVHLSGERAENDEFDRLKKKLNFKVIEDAAQSFLVTKHNTSRFFLGTSYEIGCFSLGITKMINMIYGGFCATNSKSLADKLRAIRNNGTGITPEHSRLEIANNLGLNFKPSDLHAYYGLENLKKFNFIKKKCNQIFIKYKKNLKSKKISLFNPNSSPTIYCNAFVKNREEFLKYCKKNRIQIHLGVRPLSLSKTVKNKMNSSLKNSIEISKHLVRLPSGPGYKISTIKKIINILNNY